MESELEIVTQWLEETKPRRGPGKNTKTPEDWTKYRREQGYLRRETVTQYVAQLKSITPCMDCGQTYPACVMDFDHVRGTKARNVSRMRDRTLTRVKEEIAKCDLVCANCHRLRTQQRNQGLTTPQLPDILKGA